VVVSAAVFLSSLDLFIVNIAFPAIRADFPGTRLTGLSWVLNGYTVVFAAFLALAGRLGDRYGHRRVFLAGLGVFTGASAVCAAAPTLTALVAARAVQALGAALVMPTSLALLLGAFPAEGRARAVGVWASIGAMAAALGPPLGGLLVELSWHWIFLVNVPVGLLALVAGSRVLGRADRVATGRPDVLGAVALVVAIGSLAFALTRAPDTGWVSVDVLGGGLVTLAGLALVVVRSVRHPVPALDLAVLRVPAMTAAGLIMTLFSTAFAGMLVVNVLFLTGTWQYSVLRAGLALVPGPLVVVVVARVAGWLVARFGAGTVAGLGAAAFGLGSLSWLLRLGPEREYLAGLLPGQLLTGLGVGLVLPTLSAVVGSSLPAPQWGSGSSLINTARQVGAVLGVALVVSVMGSGTTGSGGDLALLRHGWVLVVVAAAAGALVAGGLALHERRARPAPTAAGPVGAAVEQP